MARRESARITLHGNAEFEAWDVVLSGDCCFSVPDGHRMVVTSVRRPSAPPCLTECSCNYPLCAASVAHVLRRPVSLASI